MPTDSGGAIERSRIVFSTALVRPVVAVCASGTTADTAISPNVSTRRWRVMSLLARPDGGNRRLMLPVDGPDQIDPVRFVLDDALVEYGHTGDTNCGSLVVRAIVDFVALLLSNGDLRDLRQPHVEQQ